MIEIKPIQTHTPVELKSREFERLSSYIFKHYGINFPSSKKIMIQSRLQKRLRALHLDNFKDYCDYVFSEEGKKLEINHLLSTVSTNKTAFFREISHFNFILNELYINPKNQHIPGHVRIWSAGSSSGEEGYSLAMVFNELKDKGLISDFSVFGSDISEKVIEQARSAIYPYEKHKDIDQNYRTKYLLKSKQTDHPKIRICPELRAKVKFVRLNLLEDNTLAKNLFDIIFCRNTLIYFDRNTQRKVMLKLLSKLKSGGYIFIGHSESLINMNLPIEQIRPTIYKKLNWE